MSEKGTESVARVLSVRRALTEPRDGKRYAEIALALEMDGWTYTPPPPPVLPVVSEAAIECIRPRWRELPH